MTPDLSSSPKIRLKAGIFFISFSMLMFQVLLTRIFSVTLFYHFAFLAVSLGMFGLTLGAVLVRKHQNFFKIEDTINHLSYFSLAFGVCAFSSLLFHLMFPLSEQSRTFGIVGLIVTLLALVGSFTLGGINLCLCLTRFPSIVGKLYCFDLIGSAFGALSLIVFLPLINGPSAILIVVITSCFAAIAFSPEKFFSKIKLLSYGALTLAGVFLGLEILRPREDALIHLSWVKGKHESPALFERWNSFSRVTVKDMESVPFGWGLSSKYPKDARIDQKYLEIDSGASTPITSFNGSFYNLNHLKADVVNLAHYLRTNAEVFVVGVGGGRDILTALTFNQKSVVGAEINQNIIEALTEKFAEYSGNIAKFSNVRIVNDEARSFIARNKDSYDIIQISLVDTAAAHASGAFVMSENSLYTSEAIQQFIKHLKINGILSVSRWWDAENTVEAYRTVSLLRDALFKSGVVTPERNIIAIVNPTPLWGVPGVGGIITVLASPSPFTPQDEDRIAALAKEFDFRVVYSPTRSSDPIFSDISTLPTAQLPHLLNMRISPPTDDAPFFFFLTQASDLFSGNSKDPVSARLALTLVASFFLFSIVSYITLVKPFRLSATKERSGSSTIPIFLFFASIGFGYMLLEVALMLWFSSFLGHPTYGITVVLFGLLLSTGCGSYLSEKIKVGNELKILLLLFVIMILIGTIYPSISSIYREDLIAIRIAVTIALITPLGLCMGFMFPLGIRIAKECAEEHLTSFWGVNGAASVSAGSLALMIALFSTIWSVFLVGLMFYGSALIFYCLSKKKLGANSSASLIHQQSP